MLGERPQLDWKGRIAALPSFYPAMRAQTAAWLEKNKPLKFPLMEVQKTAVAHLAGLRYGLLFDEMGVGKTCQSLAISEIFYRDGLTVIVCPNSVKSVWQQEIRKFTHCAERDVYVGSVNDLVGFSENAVKNFRYFIVNYDAFMAAGKRQEWESYAPMKRAKHIVLDECHAVKSASTKRFMSLFHQLKLSPPEQLTILSGTPLDKYAGDFYSYMAMLDLNPHVPGNALHDVFPNFTKWEEWFCVPRHSGRGYMGVIENKIPQIDEILGWRVLRRRMLDVVEMPPLSKQDIELPDHLFEIDMEEVLEEFKTGLRLLNYLSTSEDAKGPEAGLGKMQKARVQLAEAKAPLSWQMARKYLQDVPRIIIFTQFHKSLEMLRDYAQNDGVPFFSVTGDNTKEERDRAIEAHKSSPRGVLAATYEALSEGANLQHATVIIRNDLSWRPLVHLQADRRIWRTGQTKPCYIVNLLCRADQVVLKCLERKENIIEKFDKIFDRKRKEITGWQRN